MLQRTPAVQALSSGRPCLVVQQKKFPNYGQCHAVNNIITIKRENPSAHHIVITLIPVPTIVILRLESGQSNKQP